MVCCRAAGFCLTAKLQNLY